MKPFVAKLKDDKHLLGIGLSTDDVNRVLAGEQVSIDLGSLGVGLWFRETDGRTFVQPRDCTIVLIRAETKDDVGKFLGVQLP